MVIIEGVMVLLALVAILIYVIYSLLFEGLSEPETCWQCQSCSKKEIGMKTTMLNKGWQLDKVYLCSSCQNRKR